MTTRARIVVVLLCVFVLARTSGGGVLPSVIAPADPTAVTYVYEKDDTDVPKGVEAALNDLNRRGILATSFEVDTKNGNGDVPAQYVVPKRAAEEAGLPALVVTAGEEVLRVVSAPETKDEALEAAR